MDARIKKLGTHFRGIATRFKQLVPLKKLAPYFAVAAASFTVSGIGIGLAARKHERMAVQEAVMTTAAAKQKIINLSVRQNTALASENARLMEEGKVPKTVMRTLKAMEGMNTEDPYIQTVVLRDGVVVITPDVSCMGTFDGKKTSCRPVPFPDVSPVAPKQKKTTSALKQ